MTHILLEKTVHWYRMQKGIFSKGKMERNKKCLKKKGHKGDGESLYLNVNDNLS
jgi:hypothetical protein